MLSKMFFERFILENYLFGRSYCRKKSHFSYSARTLFGYNVETYLHWLKYKLTGWLKHKLNSLNHKFDWFSAMTVNYHAICRTNLWKSETIMTHGSDPCAVQFDSILYCIWPKVKHFLTVYAPFSSWPYHSSLVARSYLGHQHHETRTAPKVQSMCVWAWTFNTGGPLTLSSTRILPNDHTVLFERPVANSRNHRTRNGCRWLCQSHWHWVAPRLRTGSNYTYNRADIRSSREWYRWKKLFSQIYHHRTVRGKGAKQNQPSLCVLLAPIVTADLRRPSM